MLKIRRKEKEMKKYYLDRLTFEDAIKYRAQGLEIVTGNGHVYAIVPKKLRHAAEEMRMVYDSYPEEEQQPKRGIIRGIIAWIGRLFTR